MGTTCPSLPVLDLKVSGEGGGRWEGAQLRPGTELPPLLLPGFLHHPETVTFWSEKKSGSWCVARAEAALEDSEGSYWALFLSNRCPLEGLRFEGAARRADSCRFARRRKAPFPGRKHQRRKRLHEKNNAQTRPCRQPLADPMLAPGSPSLCALVSKLSAPVVWSWRGKNYPCETPSRSGPRRVAGPGTRLSPGRGRAQGGSDAVVLLR